jgi:hypothetical protein
VKPSRIKLDRNPPFIVAWAAAGLAQCTPGGTTPVPLIELVAQLHAGGTVTRGSTALFIDLWITFGEPEPVAGLDLGTQDGLVLIFDSTRNGDSDIFIATRTSTAQAFPSPTRLSAVNSSVNEYNVFLTLDERELFFSSNRPTGAPHHLFRSLRSCD